MRLSRTEASSEPIASAISLSLKPITFACLRISGARRVVPEADILSALRLMYFLNASISSSSRLNHGSNAAASCPASGASSDLTAFKYACLNVRPIAIASPTDFI